jgi:hypothetical protein
MPSAPSEPEKYSIDEMMDRLKGPSSETEQDGKLVTRADGTQAIKVRKRKRRSNQPQKEELQRTRRSRIIQVSGAFIVLLILALTIGAAIIYANSSPFREKLLQNIAQASGATVDLQQFRMNPKTANAGQVVLAWPPGNVLKKLVVTNLNAEIFPSSFLGKSLDGEEISADYGILNLQMPKAGDPVTQSPVPIIQSAIHFNRYRSGVLDLTLGDEASPAISLTKSEGSLTPRNANRRAQLSLYKGSLALSGWPKLRLDRALIEFRGDELDIVGLRVLNEKSDRGFFELSGTIFPYRPQQPSRLAVNLDSFELAGLIGPELGRLFSGRIDSQTVSKSNYLSFMPTENPSPKFEISFRAAPTSRIELQGLPFLFILSQILEYQWFEHPVFETESSGSILREAGVVSLRNLNFQSKGHLALRGEISIAANQTLSGHLQVGVADGIISTSGNSRFKSIFGPLQDDFHWVEIKVGGSTSAPTDTFKDLFSATANSRDASDPFKNVGSSFDELTRPK